MTVAAVILFRDPSGALADAAGRPSVRRAVESAWAGGATPIHITGKGAQRGQGWAVFNDHYRDALKGNVFDARATGFIQSGFNIAAVKKGICGAVGDFADSPLETVNYVECHDNHTLWDRLLISTAENASVTDADSRAVSDSDL